MHLLAIMIATMLNTPTDIMQQIAQRAKTKRLALNLSQQGLALRSGVSLGSIKRFEQQGEISLKSLLKLALVLNSLDNFEYLFTEQEATLSLQQLIASKKTKQRGQIT